jgi:hypothetical protein
MNVSRRLAFIGLLLIVSQLATGCYCQRPYLFPRLQTCSGVGCGPLFPRLANIGYGGPVIGGPVHDAPYSAGVGCSVASAGTAFDGSAATSMSYGGLHSGGYANSSMGYGPAAGGATTGGVGCSGCSSSAAPGFNAAPVSYEAPGGSFGMPIAYTTPPAAYSMPVAQNQNYGMPIAFTPPVPYGMPSNMMQYGNMPQGIPIANVPFSGTPIAGTANPFVPAAYSPPAAAANGPPNIPNVPTMMPGSASSSNGIPFDSSLTVPTVKPPVVNVKKLDTPNDGRKLIAGK